MNQTITIKLKPYLQEYLKCRFNNPLTVSNKNIIGAIINPFLEIRPIHHAPEFHSSPEYITFEILNRRDLDTRNGTIYVSPESQVVISNIIHAHFKDIFFSYVDDKIRYESVIGGHTVRNKQIKTVILQFCIDYNISFNTITYEMLKKAYYRHRKELLLCNKNSKKQKIFTNKLSL